MRDGRLVLTAMVTAVAVVVFRVPILAKARRAGPILIRLVIALVGVVAGVDLVRESRRILDSEDPALESNSAAAVPPWRGTRRLTHSAVLSNEFLKPGLHEALVTRRLEESLAHFADGPLVADVGDLRDAEASDRISRHLAGIVARAIDRVPEGKRSEEAVRIAVELIRRLQPLLDVDTMSKATSLSTRRACLSHCSNVFQTDERSRSSDRSHRSSTQPS